ncbi:MAG: DUF2357 domain-containing protein [Candidatus Omnitrophica bacterium]|nr:DUF2357 domain-containing protein [Candidatus Omnitrophota bacterium]
MQPDFNIPLPLQDGTAVNLQLWADDPEYIQDCADAHENGEARFQLSESRTYQYRLDSAGYVLGAIRDGVVVSSSFDGGQTGRIVPGIYTGRLVIPVLRNQVKVAEVEFEIRSLKTDYRTDYRHMLADIAEHCVDLVMQCSSPVTQQFTPDYAGNPHTLYQQFSFVKSIVNSQEFRDAVQRIVTSPVSRWSEEEKSVDIRKSARPDVSLIRQFASGKRRVVVNGLLGGLASLPERVIVKDKTDTVDVPENRFVKYVLSEFRRFAGDVKSKMAGNSPEYRDAGSVEADLERILQEPFFREISSLQALIINSPALQRREGYRDVLKAWYMFDTAAKLSWAGGEDVYDAGKRDVAVLYEYWVFFELLMMARELFNMDFQVQDHLITTSNGLGLALKSGSELPFEGRFNTGARKFNMKFWYNRVFGRRNYPGRGSWTREMRPDYTFSFWPDGVSEEQAEEQELIVHIHFDAKYKVERINEILGDGEVDLDAEKIDQRKGTYKRADLLKMHAYKDAIRRTAGAYILYPGSEASDMRGFHEILPGLGAFPLRPSASGTGIDELKEFIKKVVSHLQYRATRREHLSYHVYDSQRTDRDDFVDENAFAGIRAEWVSRHLLPELEDGVRTEPVADIIVLAGFVRDAEHWRWIQGEMKYNFRHGQEDRGALRLDDRVSSARYLLLHTDAFAVNNLPKLFRIIPDSMRAQSRVGLVSDEAVYQYRPHHDEYLVVGIEAIAFDVTLNIQPLALTQEPLILSLGRLLAVQG